MKKLQSLQLSENQAQKVVGGRSVEKLDIDGDGKWDIKIIDKKNKTI